MTVLTPRDGQMLRYFNGAWWAYGGWNPSDTNFPGYGDAPPSPSTNEVWSSPDLVTWTLRLAHDKTRGPKPRHWPGFLIYNDAGTDYLYVLGGDAFSAADPDFSAAPSNGYQCDVWRSANGTTWTRVCDSFTPTWAGRMVAVFGASPGKLWCFGGQNGLLGEAAGQCVIHNDLHVSIDGGATWSVVLPDAPASATRPSGRGIISQMVYWRRKMWLISGGTYDCAGFPNRQYFREVWSFDPANTAAGFTRHTNPPFVGVEYNSVEVFENRLWLLSGYTGDGTGADHGQNTRWVWSTSDGEVWRREETPVWNHSHADGTAVGGSTLGRIAGNGSIQDGVWHAYANVATPYYTATSVPAPRAKWRMADAVLGTGNNIDHVPDSSGNGHDLIVSTPGDAVLNASNADFGGAKTADSTGAGRFLHSTNAIDMSSCTIFLVAKFKDKDAGLGPLSGTTAAFYWLYAINGGDYLYMFDVTSTIPHRRGMSYGVQRGATLTSGGQVDQLEQYDVRHLYCVHYDGTAAGSMVRVDGAVSVPDQSAITNNAGTAAFSTNLWLLSDNFGSGQVAGSVAEARVYPALTLAQIQAVEAELRATYPYLPPP